MASHYILGKAKTGAVSGIVAGFALFSAFIGIDAQLNVERGTFYEMIGIVAGLEKMDAIALGFFAHMSTAALIGAVFCIISTAHRALNLVTVPKGILAGGVTGLVVFGLFFMPIHIFIMEPILDYEITHEDGKLDPKTKESLSVLLSNTENLLAGSALLHLLYGVIMGLFCGMILYEDYKTVKRIGIFF